MKYHSLLKIIFNLVLKIIFFIIRFLKQILEIFHHTNIDLHRTIVMYSPDF